MTAVIRQRRDSPSPSASLPYGIDSVITVSPRVFFYRPPARPPSPRPPVASAAGEAGDRDYCNGAQLPIIRAAACHEPKRCAAREGAPPPPPPPSLRAPAISRRYRAIIHTALPLPLGVYQLPVPRGALWCARYSKCRHRPCVCVCVCRGARACCRYRNARVTASRDRLRDISIARKQYSERAIYAGVAFSESERIVGN